MGSRGLLTLVFVLGACGGTSPTYHAFAISSDVAASGDELAAALFQSVGATMSPGHTVQRLDNGAMFDALLADIARARSSIDVVMYIWETGKVSTRLTDAIAAKARAGVACRIVIDSFGSLDFEKTVAPPLVAAGCEVRIFRPFPRNSPLLRNHRKIFVIDGLVAFTGGHCVRDEWLGDGITNEAWRDTSVRFTGPAVRDAHQAFAENWQEAGGKLLPATTFPAQPTDGSSRVAFVSSTASPTVTRAERLTLLVMAAAKKRLWIANAYFVPSTDVVAMLERKAAEGVDVRLLVPDEHDDSKVALVAQRRFYSRLAKAGIRIWEYQPSMMHAKTMVVDDTLSVVGSINMEPLSLNKLDEGAVVIDDAAFAAEMAQSFLRDCAHGKLEAGTPPDNRAVAEPYRPAPTPAPPPSLEDLAVRFDGRLERARPDMLDVAQKRSDLWDPCVRELVDDRRAEIREELGDLLTLAMTTCDRSTRTIHFEPPRSGRAYATGSHIGIAGTLAPASTEIVLRVVVRGAAAERLTILAGGSRWTSGVLESTRDGTWGRELAQVPYTKSLARVLHRALATDAVLRFETASGIEDVAVTEELAADLRAALDVVESL